MESLPTRVVVSEDKGEAYEMNKATVFELESGRFAMAVEQGCSCYGADDADIELFPTEEAAMKSFKRWDSGE